MTDIFTLPFGLSLVPILSILVCFVYCDSSIVDLGYSLHRGYLLVRQPNDPPHCPCDMELPPS